ncbi:MAG TPA: SRPBCC family protein [Candidatus Eremiobacteraceae bacterium]|nr:SRPBCC family protein [Candidatus Eremiobacteraceae bacterium]
MESSTDRIEKHILLRAPQERVWSAISDSAQFGSWFGMELNGPFAAGAHVTGKIKPTTVDAEVAKMQEKYAGTPVSLFVERFEPMRTLSFRWHPFALDPAVDYSKEPMTTVTFTLEQAEGGTMLTVIESGFDAIPVKRRADAFEANEEGWSLILQLVDKYVRLHQS